MLQYVTIDYYDGVYYCLSKKDGILFASDGTDKCTKGIGRVTGEKELFLTSALVNERLYFFPYYGNSICVYDITNRTIKRIDSCLDLENMYCSDATPFGKEIFLNAREGIMVYDTISNRFKIEKFLDYSNSVTNCLCCFDGSLWIPLGKKDSVLQYDTFSGESKIWDLPQYGICYNTATCANGYIWLSGDKDYIVRWKPYDNDCSIIRIATGKFRLVDRGMNWNGIFSGGIHQGKYIYYAPLNSNALVKLNCETNTSEILKVFTDDEYCFQIKELNSQLIHLEVDEYRISPNCMKYAYLIRDDSLERLIIDMNNIEWSIYFKNKDKANCKIEYEYNGMLQDFIESL